VIKAIAAVIFMPPILAITGALAGVWIGYIAAVAFGVFRWLTGFPA
jgi:hypothetical protein